MTSVGVDVSKGKSTIFAMDDNGKVYLNSIELIHTTDDMNELVDLIRALPEPVKIVMENTGYYHWPVANTLLEAGFFVCIVNPILMNKFSKVKMRHGKTDKLDSVMICKYGLSNWNDLVSCTFSNEARDSLKLYSRQYSGYVKLMTQQKVNLGCLLDKVMPGIQTLLRDENSRSKLSDFVVQFWHFERIANKSLTSFTDSYCKWAKRKGYHANESKAHAIYTLSQNGIPTLPCNESTKFIVQQAARTLIDLENSVASILTQMNQLARSFPEYDTVVSMQGVGDRTAPRLIAEIGDASRFHSAKALVAYAGLDSPPFQSGNFEGNKRKISKRGDKYLRKVGYEVMSVLMTIKPEVDNAVYEFICKKRAQGKYYLSAYMAGLNKFLHIYYARVKPLLSA